MNNIISNLSSQLKINNNGPNKLAAGLCLNNPDLLLEIKDQFTSNDKKLIGDCCEVFTETGLSKPEFIAPYAEDLLPLIHFKDSRIRWEAMHSISLISQLKPDFIESILEMLFNIIQTDKSIIVRDYAVDSISNYAGCNLHNAKTAYPFLKDILGLWDGRHAGRVLVGFINIIKNTNIFNVEILSITKDYENHPKGVVSKAAKKLVKIIGK